jgi:hypothetical protein
MYVTDGRIELSWDVEFNPATRVAEIRVARRCVGEFSWHEGVAQEAGQRIIEEARLDDFKRMQATSEVKTAIGSRISMVLLRWAEGGLLETLDPDFEQEVA